VIGGTPASVSAPKVMKVPPPATALMAPEAKPERKSRQARSRVKAMFRCIRQVRVEPV